MGKACQPGEAVPQGKVVWREEPGNAGHQRARLGICSVCGSLGEPPCSSPTRPPGTALSQSLCRLLLPLQLWGDEAPVIHSLDPQLAPSGPLPFPGCRLACQLITLKGWPQTQTPPQCQGQQERRAPAGRALSLLFCLAPHWPALSEGAERPLSHFQDLAPAGGTAVALEHRKFGDALLILSSYC